MDRQLSGGDEGNVADAVTLAAALAEAQAAGVARLDAELLLAAATTLPRSAFVTGPGQPVPPAALARFRAGVARRAAGEPLAYIEGRRGFWTLALDVTPAVLVPRPETELLVERCLARVTAPAARVADLGTGSGAIALALASERPGWRLVAVDRSAAALAVAAGNAQRLGLPNVAFRQGSWCGPLAGERFDAIASNPPYIAPGDPHLPALRFEPQEALVAADHGLADLRAIIDCAPGHLLPGGVLLLEHGGDQAAAVRDALVRRGYARVVCLPDPAGLDRVTEATWP